MERQRVEKKERESGCREREGDRQTERQTERQRERNTERHRETEKVCVCFGGGGGGGVKGECRGRRSRDTQTCIRFPALFFIKNVTCTVVYQNLFEYNIKV